MIKARILTIEAEAALGSGSVEELERKGHEVLFARDRIEGFHALRKHKPDIVLTDGQMGGKNVSRLLRQIGEVGSKTKIIVVTGDTNQEKVTDELGRNTISYLKKPVAPWELREVVEKLMGIEHSEINTECVVEESKRIIMGNQIDEIWGIVNQLLICAENVCGKENLQELGLGLYEIIINAIEHGSLEISFEEKCQAIEDNVYRELLRERLSHPVYSRRRVTIDYHMTPGELHYVIRDEGEGFDWRILSCSDPVDNLLNPCGRGIFLARMYLDRVEYNEKGNEVRLVKYAKREGGNYGCTAKNRRQEG
jgi:CheY-like chemotaxis protein/anti-sigma regulatory factor (Ser/Thr protein kinase)